MTQYNAPPGSTTRSRVLEVYTRTRSLRLTADELGVSRTRVRQLLIKHHPGALRRWGLTKAQEDQARGEPQ